MPTAIQDKKQSDTAEEIEPSLEALFDDTQYFFSSAQNPNKDSLVIQTSHELASALVNRSHQLSLFEEISLPKKMIFLWKQYCHLHSRSVAVGQRQSMQQQYH